MTFTKTRTQTWIDRLRGLDGPLEDNATNAGASLVVRTKGMAGPGVAPIFNKPTAVAQLRAPIRLATDSSQQIEWKTTDGAGSSQAWAGFSCHVVGYHDPLG